MNWEIKKIETIQDFDLLENFYKKKLPKFLDQCKQLNILGKKNKQSVSKVFFSENYPNYK